MGREHAGRACSRRRLRRGRDRGRAVRRSRATLPRSRSPGRGPVRSRVACVTRLAACNLCDAGRRQKIELRPEPPLDYEKLSDPILVTRAKNGDAAALWPRSASGTHRVSSGWPRTCCPIRRTPATPPRTRSRRCASGMRQFRGEAQFTTWLHRLVVNTCRDVGRTAALAALGAARSRTSEPAARTATPSGCWRCPSSAPSSPPSSPRSPREQARVVVLKDAFDWSFAEIAVGVRDARRHREVLRAPGADDAAVATGWRDDRDRPLRPGRDRDDHPAPRPVPLRRRGARAGAGRARASPASRCAATSGSSRGTFRAGRSCPA